MSKREAGFIIDVPVTLTVAVRGKDLTEERSFEIARNFAYDLAPHAEFVDGYSDSLPDGVKITEASLESSAEDSCEVLDILEEEEEFD